MKPLVQQYPTILFFSLAFAISWLIWLVGFSLTPKPTLENSMGLLLLGSFAPSMAALVLTFFEHGWAKTKTLFGQLWFLRQHWRFYVLVFYLFPVAMLAVLLLGFYPAGNKWLELGVGLLVMPINALLTALLTPGPLGEELGWRGYALPRLEQRLGFWGGVVVLGIVWAYWHLPIAWYLPEWRELVPQLSFEGWLLAYPISVICLSVMLGLVYQATKSIGLCVLLHGTINYTASLLGHLDTALAPTPRLLLLLSGFAIATLLMWWLLRPQSSREKVER